MTFTRFFGDTPRNRLLDFLGDHVGSDYSVTELSDKADVSRPTVYRELPHLLKAGFVRYTRDLGTSKLFALNTDNPIVREVLTADFAATAGQQAPSARRR